MNANAKVMEIASLARINLTREEASKFAKDFDDVLNWASELNELDLENVEPSTHGHAMKMRSDRIDAGRIANELMAHAPNAIDNHYAVPKMIGESL